MPALFFFSRHVVGVRTRGEGSRARAVLENEAARKPHAARQVKRRLEVLSRLAGEADDEIRRDGHLGSGLADHRDALGVLRRRVTPLHALQDRVGARLGGHVEVGAEERHVAKERREARGHGLRMARDEPQAPKSRRFRDFLHEVREIPRAAALLESVTVDGLAEERHFADAPVHQPLHFLGHGGG